MSLRLSQDVDASRASYARLRQAYLDGRSFPADDMWLAFADAATHYALFEGEREVGVIGVDGEGVLLRFQVLPEWVHRASALLDLGRRMLGLCEARVDTGDPLALSTLLDRAEGVRCHSRFYHLEEPGSVDPLTALVGARGGDQGEVVSFEEEALGAPRSFLESYVRARIERGELLLHRQGGELVAVGELRRQACQGGVAHLGLIVGRGRRGRGLGTRLLAALVERALAEGVRPYCSTERENRAARCALERCGFRSVHRLLSLTLPVP